MKIYQYVFWDSEETGFHYVEGSDKDDVDKRAWDVFREYLTIDGVDTDTCIPQTFEEFRYMPCLFIAFKWRGSVEVDYHEIEFEVIMK